MASSNLTVDVYDGAEKPPRSTLSVDVQHAQYLQEPHASVIRNNWQSLMLMLSIHHDPGFCSSAVLQQKVQVAQLSQRDRAAGWVSFGQKWKMIVCRQYRSILTTVTKQACKAIEFGGIKQQNKGYYAVQDHSRSQMSVPIERSYATSY